MALPTKSVPIRGHWLHAVSLALRIVITHFELSIRLVIRVGAVIAAIVVRRAVLDCRIFLTPVTTVRHAFLQKSEAATSLIHISLRVVSLPVRGLVARVLSASGRSERPKLLLSLHILRIKSDLGLLTVGRIVLDSLETTVGLGTWAMLGVPLGCTRVLRLVTRWEIIIVAAR